SLNGARIAGADFEEASLSGVDFDLVRGASHASGLETTRLSHDARHAETCRLPWTEKYCDWERLRRFGRLPLFGVSYTALLLIPVYMYSLAMYNQKIEAAQHWAEMVEARAAEARQKQGEGSFRAGGLRERSDLLLKRGEAL